MRVMCLGRKTKIEPNEHFVGTIEQEEEKGSSCRRIVQWNFGLYGAQMKDHIQHKKMLEPGDGSLCTTVGGIVEDLNRG